MVAAQSDSNNVSLRAWRRPRIRWYHLYFLLAIFDVVVIMFSLHLHKRTIEGVGEMIGSASVVDAQLRLLQLAQQRIVELNAPGNDLFRTETPAEYGKLLRRFQLAKEHLSSLLDSIEREDIDIQGVRTEVAGMTETADVLFREFRPMSESRISDDERQTILLAASPAMAAMDRHQHQALWILGGLVMQNSDQKSILLQSHEANLEQRAVYQRYFVAAVILILIGILLFGRHLQASSHALEEQRRLVAEERRERLAAIGELCSTVAHGIRNPLAAICSSVELTLEQTQLDAKATTRLQETLREGERLGDRVNGLMDVARMNRERLSPVRLSEVIAQAARELRPEMDKRGIALKLNVEPPEPVVHGNRRYLELAVIELMSNAMEHSQSGDTIRASCARSSASQTAVIVVEDEGPGITEAVRQRVFDLFFTTRQRGTGIGLASVKRVAQIHGGDAQLAPKGASGAKFIVTLPLRAGSGDAQRLDDDRVA